MVGCTIASKADPECGSLCAAGKRRITAEVDKTITSLIEAHIDEDGVARTNVQAFDVVIGFMCRRRSWAEPCEPIQSRLEIRPASPLALTRTD